MHLATDPSPIALALYHPLVVTWSVLKAKFMSSSKPTQHAEFLQPSFSSTQATGFAPSAHDSELQHIRCEHARLMQTHQAFQADLRELREVHAEVRVSIQVAQSLKAELSQARSQNIVPEQPVVSQISNPSVRLYDSTTLADDRHFAVLCFSQYCDLCLMLI